jgi:hypothetical protein
MIGLEEGGVITADELREAMEQLRRERPRSLDSLRLLDQSENALEICSR